MFRRSITELKQQLSNVTNNSTSGGTAGEVANDNAGSPTMLVWDKVLHAVSTSQGKLEKVEEFLWSGKILFLKSENDPGSCRLQISVILVSSDIKKQANLQLTLNIQKLEVFQLQGDFAHPLLIP